MTPAEATKELERLRDRAATILHEIRSNRSLMVDRLSLGHITEIMVGLWPISGAEDGDRVYITYLINAYISAHYREKYRP